MITVPSEYRRCHDLTHESGLFRRGLTVVEFLTGESSLLPVRGIDMLDETPILDIKPYLANVVPEVLHRGWLAEAEARRKDAAC